MSRLAERLHPTSHADLEARTRWEVPADKRRTRAGAGLAVLLINISAGCDRSPASGAPDGGAEVADAPGEAAPAPRRRVVEIAAGWSHTCARLAEGSVWCWGSNTYGALGGGAQAMLLRAQSTPMEVRGLSGVAELALGGNHSCARMSDGTVRCWGLNENGQLGDDLGGVRDAPEPVAGLAGVRRIAAGRQETCAVLVDGTVRCWGGLPGPRGKRPPPAPIAQSASPAPVPGLSGAVAVAMGTVHACALKNDGTVACWGDNSTGQLGDGTTAARPEPVPVQGVRDAIQIAAFMSASCALLRGGNVICWGATGGTAEDAQEASPGALDLRGIAEISSACARGIDGSVRCRRGEQVSVVTQRGAAQITFGVAHGCLLTAAGEARCWGANRNGELGDGTESDHLTPTPVVW